MDTSKQRLKDVLSIPSYPGKETGVSDFITNFCVEHQLDHYMDKHGNMYVTKGVSDVYPCVVSHMDTVHMVRPFKVMEKTEGTILYGIGEYGRRAGIGGDDKAGVFVCLEMLLQADVVKAAFFVGEEVGCLGSYLSDPKFFENVGYAIQFDAPERNWISWFSDGTKLFEKDGDFYKAIEPIFETDMFEYTPQCLASHPYTDVCALKRLYGFSCINYSVGYYNMHSPKEYVVISEVFEALEMAKKMVKSLGNKLYPLVSKQLVTEGEKEHKERRLAYYKSLQDDFSVFKGSTM